MEFVEVAGDSSLQCGGQPAPSHGDAGKEVVVDADPAEDVAHRVRNVAAFDAVKVVSGWVSAIAGTFQVREEGSA